MDNKTITTYNQSAAQIAALHNTLVPESLYRIMDSYFVSGALCADVGCGIGRDSNWLLQQGYQVTGIDAAEQMLFEAREHYPDILFIHDSLPMLKTIENNLFANVLCSAVIMHLEVDQIALAVVNLVRIMVEGGVIVISFRGTDEVGQREDGKLYTPISTNKLITAFASSGATLLVRESDHEVGRGLEWHNLVFKKSS
jgi:2-polyprenyl-3-methyl-5-hydroxy-6-metoxy-1,4-benzoquinol methylase